MKNAKSINLPAKYYPEAVEIINELAALLDRTPHDTANKLIIDAGQKRIDELKKSEANSEQYK